RKESRRKPTPRLVATSPTASNAWSSVTISTTSPGRACASQTPASTAMRRSLQSRTPTDGALCTRCAPRSARRRAVSWFTTRQLPTATRSVVRVMRSTSRWASTRATWSARLEFSTSKKIPRRTDGCGRSGSGGSTRAAKSGSGLEVATGSASAASAGGGAPGSSSGRASGASAAARLLPPRRCRAGFLPVLTARTIANADDAGDRSATRMAPFRRSPAPRARQSAPFPMAQPMLTAADGRPTPRRRGVAVGPRRPRHLQPLALPDPPAGGRGGHRLHARPSLARCGQHLGRARLRGVRRPLRGLGHRALVAGADARAAPPLLPSELRRPGRDHGRPRRLRARVRGPSLPLDLRPHHRAGEPHLGAEWARDGDRRHPRARGAPHVRARRRPVHTVQRRVARPALPLLPPRAAVLLLRRPPEGEEHRAREPGRAARGLPPAPGRGGAHLRGAPRGLPHAQLHARGAGAPRARQLDHPPAARRRLG